MNSIVSILNQAFYEVSAFSFAAAALWGILSVFLSPCHLGSIPLIVGYINEHRAPGRLRAFKLSLMFGLGILIMLVIIGLLTGLAGRILGDTGPALTIIISVFLMGCGMWLMNLPPFRNINISPKIKPHFSGTAGAFSLGFVFGIILGPCSFAFLAPMVGLVFSNSLTDISFGITLMIFYALGHTAAIIAAGTFGDSLLNLFNRDGIGRTTVWVKRACGLAVFIFGGWKVISSF